MAKIAAGLVTGGLAGGGDAATVSEKGAKINEGRSLDERDAKVAGKPAETHEAQAADGEAGRALQILGSIAGSNGKGAGTDGTATQPDGAGNGGDAPGGSSSGSTPAKKAPAPKKPRPGQS